MCLHITIQMIDILIQISHRAATLNDGCTDIIGLQLYIKIVKVMLQCDFNMSVKYYTNADYIWFNLEVGF